MKMVKRYDRITLDRTRAIRLDNGMMKVPARIARVGVQEYRRADGSIERAYRPPDEVSASAEGFDLVPLVNDHPYADGGVVDATNAKRLTVGVVSAPKFCADFVEATLLISDAEAVRAVDAGKLECSAGYFMDRDETPGVSPDGQPYDFVQRNIRPNHVAIVWDGRAGKDVRIQLDAAFEVESPPKEKHTMKITIDGIEVEVSDMASSLIARERKLSEGLLESAKAEAKALKSDLEKRTAQCDAATAQVKALEGEIKSLPEKIKSQMTERVALEAQAKGVCPELKCDGLDAMGIKRAVLASAKIVTDGKSDDYVSARYDAHVEAHSKKNVASEAVEAALQNTNTTTITDSVDPKAARKASEDKFFGRSK